LAGNETYRHEKHLRALARMPGWPRAARDGANAFKARHGTCGYFYEPRCLMAACDASAVTQLPKCTQRPAVDSKIIETWRY